MARKHRRRRTSISFFKIFVIAAYILLSFASPSAEYSSAPQNDSLSPGTTLNAVIIINDSAGEGPLTVTFDAGKSTGDISEYIWNFGDGDTAAGITASHTYMNAGTYTATLAVTGMTSATRQTHVAITVTKPSPGSDGGPTAVISSATGDTPQTVTFDGRDSSASNPPINSYLWDFGDGSTGDGVTASHVYALPGTYHPSLTVTDSEGFSGRTRINRVIIGQSQAANTPPQASFTATPISGETPLTVTFDGSGSSNADGSTSSFHWNFGDGTTASGATATHTYTEIANYNVTLLVKGSKGTIATFSETVSVRSKQKKDVSIITNTVFK